MTRFVDPKETRPARLGRLDRLPVFLDLTGRSAAVIGGSAAAAWKAELLAAAGAEVAVYAATPSPEMLAVVAAPGEGGNVVLHRRGWQSPDLDGAAIVVADLTDDAEAARLAEAARAAGAIFNLIDRPGRSQVQFGAIVNRSPVVIGISTAGGAPVLAQAVRRRIESVLPAALGAWGRAAQRVRAGLTARLPDPAVRRRFWDRFAAAAITAAKPPSPGLVDDLISGAADAGPAGRGKVTLVGAGPGDPELLTLKAVRVLQGADVIVYDRLVGPQVLELARREARRIAAGKKGHGAGCRQDDINGLLVELAGQGLSVVRLKGGDPSVFGRAGEEIAACTAAGIEVEVVPGITAALAAAASLKASLSHRDHARRIQFVTGHDRHGRLAADLDFAALADPAATSCIYMGRATIRSFGARLIGEGLPAGTAAAVIDNASLPDERIVRTTLGALAAEGAGPGSAPVVIVIGEAIGAAAAGVEMAGEAFAP